uniref:Uncharacterized protein n=1 Tax=viral metagenome TaxID=1070528 RepID=A0A6C0CSL2_9ZZZZ
MFFHKKKSEKKNFKFGSQFKIESVCLKRYKKWFLNVE